MLFLAILLVAIALTIPPAAKVLAVIGSVYGIIALLKKAPALTPYLTGKVAFVVNIVFTLLGLLIAIPADQLYTTNTLILVITTVLGSAGIHGTVKSFSPPEMLASTPPDPTVKEVPAVIVPKDPTAVPAEKPKE